MRVKNRKNSIVKYIMTWCIVIMVFFSIFMLVCVNVVADYAVRGSVAKEIGHQIRRAARCAVERDGIPAFAGDMDVVDDDFYFVILDGEGNPVAGEYPEDYDPSCDSSGKKHLRVVKCGRSSFYVDERSHALKDKAGIEGDYSIQGIVSCGDVQTVYHHLKRYSYIMVVVEILVMTFVSIILHRRISRPMYRMYHQAQKITENLELSERIEYDGTFRELEVLLEAYNGLLARMEDVVRRQEQFNSDVSHELRTPITVIRAQCQLTREQMTSVSMDGEAAELVGETVETIERQSNRMSAIVEQLLNLSRMDQDRAPVEIEEIDLADIVEFVCEEEGASDGGDRIHCAVSPAVVHADVVLLTLAIRNLVSNAVKYSAPGTPVQVECGGKEDGAYVSVRDCGCGIAPEDLPRIFEHYYRAEKSRNSEGFGLGLTLAMKIAKKHGGTIEVESAVGSGSTFTLRIPRAQ